MWISKSSWKAQTISLKEKCHLHELSSGMKFIQTCWMWHRITTQCTQKATIQDTQIKTYRPRVCSSSVCWWGTRRPLLLQYRHCVPFQSPPPPRFPLSLGRMALQQPVGFPHYRSWGFLHLKVSDVAQRLPVLGAFGSSVGCPAANPVQTWETIMHFFMSTKWRLWVSQKLKASSINTVTIQGVATRSCRWCSTPAKNSLQRREGVNILNCNTSGLGNYSTSKCNYKSGTGLLFSIQHQKHCQNT